MNQITGLNKINVPKEALKYILYQRTAYLRFTQTIAYRVLKRVLPFSMYNYGVVIEAKIWPSKIKQRFEADMRTEYQSVKDYLPDHCNSILDIGCGVAGIDIFLNNHYRDITLHYYLLDKSKLDKSIFYGFRKGAAFYNSLEIAKKMLVLNGIDSNRIHLLYATEQNEINIHVKVDLIVSFISWGFHYPVETYLEAVHRILSEYGILILDIRKKTNGINTLKRVFNQVEIIFEREKFYRVRASK